MPPRRVDCADDGLIRSRREPLKCLARRFTATTVSGEIFQAAGAPSFVVGSTGTAAAGRGPTTVSSAGRRRRGGGPGDGGVEFLLRGKVRRPPGTLPDSVDDVAGAERTPSLTGTRKLADSPGRRRRDDDVAGAELRRGSELLSSFRNSADGFVEEDLTVAAASSNEPQPAAERAPTDRPPSPQPIDLLGLGAAFSRPLPPPPPSEP